MHYSRTALGLRNLRTAGLNLLVPSAPGRPCSVESIPSIHPSLSLKAFLRSVEVFPRGSHQFSASVGCSLCRKCDAVPRFTASLSSLPLSPFPSLSNRHNKNATDPNGIISVASARAPSTDRASAPGTKEKERGRVDCQNHKKHRLQTW